MTALPADEPGMGSYPQIRLNPEQLLQQALIDNAELTLMHVSERLDRLRKDAPEQSKEYEEIFVLVAPHVQNIKNVAEGLLSSEDDEDVHLGLDALAASMEERSADEPRIRELLVSKLGYYSPGIEAHLINTILKDPNYFLLQQQIEVQWGGFNFAQKIAAIALMGSMKYESSRDFLKELSRKGERQLRAFAADELARRPESNSEAKYGALEAIQNVLLSPDELGRFVSRMQAQYRESLQILEKEFAAAGINVNTSQGNIRTPIPVRLIPVDSSGSSSSLRQRLPDDAPANPNRLDDVHLGSTVKPVAPPLTATPPQQSQDFPAPVSDTSALPSDPSAQLEEIFFGGSSSLKQEAFEKAQRTGVGGMPQGARDDDVESTEQMGLFDHLDELRVRLFRAIFGSIAIFAVLVPVVFILGLDVQLLGQDSGHRSVLSLSVITVAYLGSIPISINLFLYQAAMYIFPGLTRRERRWVLTVGPIVTLALGSLLILSFMGSLALIRPAQMQPDVGAYMIEKLAFFLLPLLISIILIIGGSRFVVNMIRDRPQVYNVVVAGSVWLTGKFASVLVGKRDSEAMQRRIATRMGMFMYRSDQSHDVVKRFGKAMALVPHWLIKQFLRFTLLMIIPFAYIVLPALCILAVVLTYLPSARAIQWMLILGRYGAKVQTIFKEIKKELQSEGFKV